MASSVIVLLIGDVDGQFTLLFRKLNNLLTKLRSDAMAVCVGNFFSPGCENEWNKVLSGKLKAPLNIYILGPTSSDLTKFYPKNDQITDLAERITYLGKTGIFRTAEGIKLGFASGVFSETDSTSTTYTYQDLHRIVNDRQPGRCQFLLTWSWPQGITTNEDNKSETLETAPAFLFSYLAPRYHVAAREKKVYDMPITRHFVDGQIGVLSRFCGLSNLCSSSTTWIKALCINSDDDKSDTALTSFKMLNIPFLNTFYSRLNISLETVEIQYFFRSYSGQTDQRQRSHRGYQKAHREPFIKSPFECWFCLCNPNVENHLIISVGEHTYIALAKGHLIPGHVLISTIDHVARMRLADENVKIEVNLTKRALEKMYGTNHIFVYFERTYCSRHLQINCVPVPKELYSNVIESLKNLARRYNLGIIEFEGQHDSYMNFSETDHYFYAQVGNYELIIRGPKGHFPLTFGREALADNSVLNVPERIIWQKCKSSTDEETSLVTQFKSEFTFHT